MLNPESSRNLGVFVLVTRGATASEAGGSSAVKGITEAAVKQAVCTGTCNLCALTRVSLRPLPQWAALQGCTAVALMADHDNAEQLSRQCARACGALARVRRACLGRAQRACAEISTDHQRCKVAVSKVVGQPWDLNLVYLRDMCGACWVHFRPPCFFRRLCLVHG